MAVASPIPDDAPVTSATLPSSFPVMIRLALLHAIASLTQASDAGVQL
jgi:hypothetical protein